MQNQTESKQINIKLSYMCASSWISDHNSLSVESVKKKITGFPLLERKKLEYSVK